MGQKTRAQHASMCDALRVHHIIAFAKIWTFEVVVHFPYRGAPPPFLFFPHIMEITKVGPKNPVFAKFM